MKRSTGACCIAVVVCMATAAAGALADRVEDHIESALTDSVEDRIESALTDSVEDRIEEQTTDAVEQQIEDTVLQQTEDGVSAQIESGVEAGIEDQLEASVGAQVESRVEAGVEQLLTGNVEDRVEATVGLQVEAQLEAAVESDLSDGVEAGLEAQVGASVGDRVAIGVSQPLVDGVGAGVNVNADTGGTLASGASTVFAEAVSDAGDRVEQGVWIVLVPDEHTQQISDWGFTVQRQRNLPAMGMQLLRISAPEDRTLAQVALQLATDAPGTVVDQNHLYAPQQDAGGTESLCSSEDLAPALPNPGTGSQSARGRPVIGLIDGEVERVHPALADADLVQADFVEHEHPRPTAHGTAVASILVGQNGARTGAAPHARVHAASVLFEAGSGIGATTESLVAALAWQLEQDVRVINLSLTGPANRPLEAALQRANEAGAVIVAAVGNNGPAGPPLYPAAYDGVVGVSAVDGCMRAYRYAARGPQVTFSALGVDVTVARPGGRYGPDSGTSLAAPYVAAVIAVMAAQADTAPATVVELLKATAVDLGEPGVDPVFGHGLINPSLPVADAHTPGSESRVEHHRHEML